MFDLSGRSALVTGASGGIGGAIARALHRQGATVAVAGRRSAELDALVAELGGRAHALTGDLADPEAPDRLVRAAEAAMGQIDILVSNAGITRDGLALRLRDEDWQAVIEVNLTAAFRLIRAALRGMIRRRHGRVIAIASVWAFILVDERHDLAAAVLVTGAALVRPNGIVLAIALVFVLRSWRRVLLVCAPSVVAVALWCVACFHWTGDPLVFLSSKEGWPEVTVKAIAIAPWRYDYVYPHLFLALAALGALFLVRRRLPAAWTLFTVLYLLPSLGLGMVGLGRYANECFPPFVAAGVLLDRARRWVLVAAFSAAVAGQAVCAWWVIHSHYLP